MVIYTLVGSLLMLAARGGDGGAVARGPGGSITFVLSDLAARTRCRRRTQKLDLRRVRARVPDQDAGVPVPRLDAGRLPARCRCRRWPFFSGVVSKVAAYGFLRIVLPLFPAATHDFQTILLILALLSILYGSVAGVHADQRAADPRLLVGRAARLHHARDLRARPARARARRARCCRRSTTGSWSRRCSSSSRCWPSAPAARRTSATWAGSRSARRCSRRCS